MTVILSVDPGYRHCGWAVASFQGQTRVLVDAGEWQTTEEEHGHESVRIAFIVTCFVRKLEELKPDGVGIEAYTFQNRHPKPTRPSEKPKSRQNFKVAAGLTRLIDRMGEAARSRGFVVEEVPTSSAKAALGLKGRVPKSRVQRAIEAIFGTRIGSHSADAAAVCVATRTRLLARGIGR